jgi:hypothetical protein
MSTTTPTEAHIALVRNMAAQGYYLGCSGSIEDYARLLADSEARAVATLTADRDQLRSEAERTDAIYQRACEVEQELRAELATEREKAERYRLATLKLDAELAAERARLDWVFRNCKVTADDYTTGNRDVYAIHDREDLGAAMKEDAQ